MSTICQKPVEKLLPSMAYVVHGICCAWHKAYVACDEFVSFSSPSTVFIFFLQLILISLEFSIESVIDIFN